MIISVEGIIGSGKTTFIKYFSKALNAKQKLEPVSNWQDSDLLKNYYKDMPRWAFTFQLKVICDKMKEDSLIKDKNEIVLMERSVYSDKCFMEMFNNNKTVTKTEYDLYNTLCESLEKNMKNIPDIIIYLKPSLNECMKRVKKRDRKEERNLTTNYQNELLNLHNNQFDKEFLNVNGKVIPVIKLETDDNFYEDDNFISLLIKKINEFNSEQVIPC